MLKFSSLVTILLLIICSYAGVNAELVAVNSLDELQTAIDGARPGDTIELEDGRYDAVNPIQIRSTVGTVDEWITVRAQNTGGAEISGEKGFSIENSEYIVVDGFVLTHKSRTVEASFDVGLLIKNSSHIRICNNRFRMVEEGRKNYWLHVTSSTSSIPQQITIDRNHFENKTDEGCFIVIYGPSSPYAVAQHVTIAYNHFENIGPRIDNGKEAIRFGDSNRSLSSAFGVIEYNLFEDCTGDPEVLSCKASDMTIRYNTFRACQGNLVLRHGERNVAAGNFFIGTSGGIRIYGNDHKIYNNYFEQCDGESDEATLVIANGDVESGEAPLNGRQRPTRCTVAFNTLVNCTTSIDIGWTSGGALTLPPKDCALANNLVVGSSGTALYHVITEPENMTWEGNIAWAAGSADVGAWNRVTIVDPNLTNRNGLLTLAMPSAAIDNAQGSYQFISDDFEGQARAGIYDVGADEYSTAAEKRGPLTAADVGPNAVEISDSNPVVSPEEQPVESQADGATETGGSSGGGCFMGAAAY